MTCGINQGRLGSFYTAEWIFDTFREAEDEYGVRAVIEREQLIDFSLTLAPLVLTDSSTYFCEVKVGPPRNQRQQLTSPEIVLLVYREYCILLLLLCCL